MSGPLYRTPQLPKLLPGLLATDRTRSTVPGAFAREEHRLVIGEPVLLGPEQECPWQIHLAGGQENTLARTTGVLQVGEDQAVASDIHGSQGKRLTDPRTCRPENSQQKTITLARRRVDDSQDVVWREALRRLPLLARTGSDRTPLWARI
jgi:hypothetical protein